MTHLTRVEFQFFEVESIVCNLYSMNHIIVLLFEVSIKEMITLIFVYLTALRTDSSYFGLEISVVSHSARCMVTSISATKCPPPFSVSIALHLAKSVSRLYHAQIMQCSRKVYCKDSCLSRHLKGKMYSGMLKSSSKPQMFSLIVKSKYKFENANK